MKQIFYSKTKVTTELIAFQTGYINEREIRFNQALLFKDRQTAEAFFKDPLMVINTLGFKVEAHEDINECIHLLYTDNIFSGAIINLEYCGTCEVSELSCGHFIERNF